MKQEITKKQWDELSDIQKDNFWDEYNEAKEIKRGHTIDCLDLTVGEMIKFLGDEINIRLEDKECFIEIECEFINGDNINTVNFLGKGLVDTLWKAVKYKLK